MKLIWVGFGWGFETFLSTIVVGPVGLKYLILVLPLNTYHKFKYENEVKQFKYRKGKALEKIIELIITKLSSTTSSDIIMFLSHDPTVSKKNLFII